MIVAVHQPAFFPWLGYFHKMAQCDLFVLADDLQYEAQNFQNRNRVKVNNGIAWMTVPLQSGPIEERICEKRIANAANATQHWQWRMWKTLLTHYGRAPYFETYAKALALVCTGYWPRLLDLDERVLLMFRDWFGIRCPIIRSSSLDVSGEKTEWILNVCRRVGADTYLSGRGGSTICLDVDRMVGEGVRVEWQNFCHPVYPQLYPSLGFIRNLSAIDLVLNCGPASRSILLGKTPSVESVGEAVS